jgi:hypothetical protein
LENFFLKVKTNYDKGNYDWMIELTTTTKLTTILAFDPHVKLHFLPKDTILSFSRHMFQLFATTMLPKFGNK